jgi:arylsulfotransferase ASST
VRAPAAIGIAGLCIGAALAPAASGRVSVYPSPGTPTASPRTQISFRGLAPREVGFVFVRGSRSGRHAGRLRAHSDGQGASFLPRRSFRPGERVTVLTRLDVVGARGGDFRYRIAQRPGRVRILAPPARRVRAIALRRFRSRPDLHPPVVTVGRRGPGTAPGLVILGPKPKAPRHQAGPMIVDDGGETIWYRPLGGRIQAADVRVQTYRGRPVLTWWQGTSRLGIGRGHFVIVGQDYRLVRRVQAGNGYRGDLHEFLITPRDTAILIAYPAVRANLASVGASRRGVAIDSVVQELDLRTGLVLFEWHSLGNVPLRDSYFPPPPSRRNPYDYFHANGAGLAPDGDVVVCARNTWGVYKIDRETGRTVWQLGGRRNQFKRGRGARFTWQHDAHFREDGTLSVFDNAASPRRRDRSRALVLSLDEAGRTARLALAREHPRGLLAATQGDVQSLPGGNLFVGWGSRRYFTEYGPDGSVLWDARLAVGYDTYRAYRAPWTGTPATRPRAAAVARRGGRMDVYASWNGATGVASWELLAGPRRTALAPVATAPRAGFETRVRVRPRARWVAVRAHDAGGAVLATSPPRRVRRR